MTLSEVRACLGSRPNLPLFAERPWDAELAAELREVSPEPFFVRSIRDPRMAACAIAGLHLLNDDFTAAHVLCQEIHTPTGSYWHQLCHRREGERGEGLAANLSNTRYWIRQTGVHPIHPTVREEALRILASGGSGFRWVTEATGQLQAAEGWSGEAIVDWIGLAATGAVSPASIALIEEIQRREIELLLDWCVEQTT